MRTPRRSAAIDLDVIVSYDICRVCRSMPTTRLGRVAPLHLLQGPTAAPQLASSLSTKRGSLPANTPRPLVSPSTQRRAYQRGSSGVVLRVLFRRRLRLAALARQPRLFSRS